MRYIFFFFLKCSFPVCFWPWTSLSKTLNWLLRPLNWMLPSQRITQSQLGERVPGHNINLSLILMKLFGGRYWKIWTWNSLKLSYQPENPNYVLGDLEFFGCWVSSSFILFALIFGRKHVAGKESSKETNFNFGKSGICAKELNSKSDGGKITFLQNWAKYHCTAPSPAAKVKCGKVWGNFFAICEKSIFVLWKAGRWHFTIFYYFRISCEPDIGLGFLQKLLVV